MRIGDLSGRTGVSTHQLRAWERRYGLLRPRRSAGNYRLYSPVDELRVQRMQRYLADGLPAAHAAELTIATRFEASAGHGRAVPSREAIAAQEEMRGALARFDETSAQRTLERLFVTFTPTTVMRDVLLPYMHELGEQWSAGRVSVADEHFATNFFQARLYAVARNWDRGLGPRALLACAPEEQHTLALMVFGIALHELGWRITYLGADTPIETLSEVAEIIQPELTVVSAAMRQRLPRHTKKLSSFTERWSLALGGPGVSARLAKQAGARYLDEDPVSAASAVSL
ncbi:MAG TPA: MerR family transcriptional regulator [Solirubrobacteraceae bacterium]|nr:MerR family transcriptional regulator [Solirubrobacteraceae bacterium]